MAISMRLHSSMDIRPDSDINEKPKRIVFLSVEGTCTEKNYFNFVEKYRDILGIDSLVHVETLSRCNSDTCSDIDKVYELLTDYLKIREEGILPEDLRSVLKGMEGKYAEEDLQKYLSDELTKKDSKELKSAIQLAGIDIDYQKFLRDYKGEGENDVFAVILDRDWENHSEEALRKLMVNCKARGCLCFLTNPCFEFWLLLHLSDVEKEYSEKYEDLRKNVKVSNQHSFVSREVSNKAGHAKRIPESKFIEHYLDNVDLAIKRAASFEQDNEHIIEKLGSSLPKLISILRESV